MKDNEIHYKNNVSTLQSHKMLMQKFLIKNLLDDRGSLEILLFYNIFFI